MQNNAQNVMNVLTLESFVNTELPIRRMVWD